MSDQRGFFDVDHRLEELSAQGDPLERVSASVDFEVDPSKNPRGSGRFLIQWGDETGWIF